MKCFTKSEKQRRYNDQILDYFFIKIPTRGRHHLLPKIHKRLYNVYMKPVISISEYYAEMISAFHEYHCKPTAQKIKSYVKGTNDFLRKLDALPPLLKDYILCTIDGVKTIIKTILLFLIIVGW